MRARCSSGLENRATARLMVRFLVPPPFSKLCDYALSDAIWDLLHIWSWRIPPPTTICPVVNQTIHQSACYAWGYCVSQFPTAWYGWLVFLSCGEFATCQDDQSAMPWVWLQDSCWYPPYTVVCLIQWYRRSWSCFTYWHASANKLLW